MTNIVSWFKDNSIIFFGSIGMISFGIVILFGALLLQQPWLANIGLAVIIFTTGYIMGFHNAIKRHINKI